MADTTNNFKTQKTVVLGYLGFCLILLLPFVSFFEREAGIARFFVAHETMHVALEVFGALLSVAMAFILWQRRYPNKFYENYRFALGFLAMGTLDFFHAMSPSEQGFVFFRSMASFTGSFFFSLVWLPRHETLAPKRDLFVWGTVLLAAGLGVWGLFFPASCPRMIKEGHFTAFASWINFFSASLFLLAASYFVRLFGISRSGEMYVLGCFMLLSGVAAALFPFSILWENERWFGLGMRLIAYFFVLGHVVRDYRKMAAVQEMHILMRRDYEQELLRNAEFLKDVLEAVSQPMCVINAQDYKVKMANTAARSLKRKGGGTCYALMYEKDRPCEGKGHDCPLEIVRKTKKSVTLERVHQDEKGERQIFEIHAYPILDEKGEVKELIEYSFDITHRKRIEEALQESEEKFREFANHSPNVFMLVDFAEAEKILYVNPEFERLWGYPAKDIVDFPRLWVECVSAKDLERVTGAFENFIFHDGLYDMEYRITSKDGTVKWIHDQAFKILTSEGQAATRAGRILQDITKQKKTLEKLRGDEQRIRTIIRTAMDGFWIMDMTGQILDVNDAYCRMSGYTREELLRMTIENIEAGENIDQIGERIQRIIQSGADRFETVHRKKDGSVFDVEVSINFLPLDGGIFVVFSRDITERKNIERRNRELLEAKENFISSVTHELRTPLTAIKEGIGIVSDGILGEVNPRQGEFLHIAKKNVDRLHRLINGVLDFQKLGAGKMAFYVGEHDLNDAVREVYDTMKVAADQKGLKLVLELDEALPLARFDRDKILQVLTNLFHNAIKFTERGGITVSTARRENTLCVSVADSGSGIPAEDLPKLFKSFQQLDNAKEKTGGSGLGLAICQEIVLRHHGKIWAESTQGKGSTFRFVLPVQERR